MTGKLQKTNVKVQNPSILEVLRKRSTDRVTDAGLSQVILLSVAQPKILPATHVTKKGHYSKVCKSSKRVHRVGEDSDEDDISVMTTELVKIRTKMISL